jgi:hypothetical protein
VEDLKRCRLVCSLWAEEGTKALIHRAKYHLRGQKDVSEFLRQVRNPNSVTKLGLLVSYRLKLSRSESNATAIGNNEEMSVSVSESEEGQPGSTLTMLLDTDVVDELLGEIGLKVISIELGPNVWSCQSLLELLYHKVGNATELCLHYATAGSLAKAIEMFRELETLRKAEMCTAGDGGSLKIEKFKFCHKPEDDGVAEAPEPKLIRRYIISELFKRMPKLKRFSCNDVLVREDFLYHFLLESANVENNPEFAGLDFPIQMNVDEVKRFHERLPYPLETMDLSLRPGLRFPALYTFLSSLGSTLKILRLDFKFLSNQTEKFPSGQDLVNLESLTFVHYNGSLDFIHSTAKLKNLTLVNANLSVAFRSDEHFDFDTPHGLQSLEVFNGRSNAGRFIFPDIFRSMAKLFPKLKKFRMEHLSDSTLKIISDGFMNLEVLHLENSICTDSGITEHLPKLSSKRR